MIWIVFGLCLQSQIFSFEKEVALGAQLAREVRARTTPVADEQIQQYAVSVGLRLASHATSSFPWTFEVVTGLDSHPPYEPLSIPGGYIFIPANLLLTAQNEMEFARMLAHAMAHQVARDKTRFVTLRGYSTIPLVFMGGSNDVAIPLAFQQIQKAKEQAADLQAVEILRDVEFNSAEHNFQNIQERLKNALPALAPRPAPSLFRPEER